MNTKEAIKYEVPEGYELEILDDTITDPDKQDPAWYVEYEGAYLLGTVTDPNDDESKIYCVGEMRFHWGEFNLRTTSAILKETPFTTDKELLEAIDRNEIDVVNNAWFEVELPDGTWEVVDDFAGAIAYIVENTGGASNEN